MSCFLLDSRWTSVVSRNADQIRRSVADLVWQPPRPPLPTLSLRARHNRDESDTRLDFCLSLSLSAEDLQVAGY